MSSHESLFYISYDICIVSTWDTTFVKKTWDTTYIYMCLVYYEGFSNALLAPPIFFSISNALLAPAIYFSIAAPFSTFMKVYDVFTSTRNIYDTSVCISTTSFVCVFIGFVPDCTSTWPDCMAINSGVCLWFFCVINYK